MAKNNYMAGTYSKLIEVEEQKKKTIPSTPSKDFQEKKERTGYEELIQGITKAVKKLSKETNPTLIKTVDNKETKTKPIGQSTSQSASQPTNQSTDKSIDKSMILGRPKAFYITEKQDKDLDNAVDKLAKKVEGKVSQKIDRSTVLRLLLEMANITTDETINKLSKQLVSRLISQLTG